MIRRLREFIERHNLLGTGDTVGVGYSGGPDSTCLLHLLATADYDVIALHLNHCQRPEADEEQAHCEAFASEIGVRCISDKADVPEMAKEMKIGIEEAGRKARYEFFRKESRQLKVAKVATGHTLDDHVETILLKLARGTGPAGLAGIPVRREGVIRPLLWARREETRRYCEERGFWTHDDPANLDRRFARVRARLDVVPGFETLHGAALENAARLVQIISDEDALLQDIVARILESCEEAPNEPLAFLTSRVEVRLDASLLRGHPLPILRRVVRQMLAPLKATPSFEHTEITVASILRSEKRSVTLEGGSVVLEITPERLTARRLEEAGKFHLALAIPGETVCGALGWTLSACETDEEAGREPRSLDVVIDAGALRGNVYLRPFERGERMQPFGSDSERKLRDLLTNAKVSAAAKARLPLVCDDLGPVWAPGVALAARVAVTERTERRLRLQFGPSPPDGTV